MIIVNTCECGKKYPETAAKFSTEGYAFCSKECVANYDIPLKTISLSAHAWDYAAEFKVSGVRGSVSLHRDYNKVGDGIYWGMQSGAILKATYTPEEIAHRERMKTLEPINNGELVLIDGEKYQARILGNFSDCVIFDKLEG
jgi:hypothetical protein